MEVRDAVEDDAAALAELADAPEDVMRNLVHDRTVRVAAVAEGDGSSDAGADADFERGPAATDGEPGNGEAGDADRDGDTEGDAGADEALLGFVSFDVRGSTVHVTQVGGSRAACERLLAEPARFADREGLDVELLLPDDEVETRAAAEAAGFEEGGPGPTFEGRPTVRYRLESPRIS
jgi:hypothetical protein